MDTLPQLGAVAVVFAGLFAALWWLRGRGVVSFATIARPRRQARLSRVDHLPLTPQHAVHLIEVDGRQLLIGTSPGGCSLLENISESTPRGGQA